MRRTLTILILVFASIDLALNIFRLINEKRQV